MVTTFIGNFGKGLTYMYKPYVFIQILSQTYVFE